MLISGKNCMHSLKFRWYFCHLSHISASTTPYNSCQFGWPTNDKNAINLRKKWKLSAFSEVVVFPEATGQSHLRQTAELPLTLNCVYSYSFCVRFMWWERRTAEPSQNDTALAPELFFSWTWLRLRSSFFFTAPASGRFHTLIFSIVLVCLKLNGKWIKTSAQN